MTHHQELLASRATQPSQECPNKKDDNKVTQWSEKQDRINFLLQKLFFLKTIIRTGDNRTIMRVETVRQIVWIFFPEKVGDEEKM